jgi:hypothetical protein
MSKLYNSVRPQMFTCRVWYIESRTIPCTAKEWEIHFSIPRNIGNMVGNWMFEIEWFFFSWTPCQLCTTDRFFSLQFGPASLNQHVSLYNYYSNKMHTFIVKSTRYYNLYFLSYILALHVSTRVGHLQGAQCQCLAKVIINYNLLKLR